MLPASAQPAEAKVKTVIPIRYRRRRPSRSPNVAAVSNSAAIGSAYASTTHCSPLSSASSEAWILASAAETIVMSSSNMNTARHTAVSVRRGCS